MQQQKKTKDIIINFMPCQTASVNLMDKDRCNRAENDSHEKVTQTYLRYRNGALQCTVLTKFPLTEWSKKTKQVFQLEWLKVENEKFPLKMRKKSLINVSFDWI